MRVEELSAINALEATHWWYRGTRDICLDVLQRYMPPRDPRILDIGCGTGGNMLALRVFGRVAGLDFSPFCVEACRAKGLEASIGDFNTLDVAADTYGLITSFDVLTQADPPRLPEILTCIRRALVPGGLFAWREPALSIASGRHDFEVNIRQRFDRGLVRRLFEQAGFELVYVTYLNALLFLPIVAVRKLQLLRSRAPRSDVWETPAPLNALLLSVLRMERALIRVGPLPFGVSIFAVGRRP